MKQARTVSLQTFITERNRSSRLTAKEKVSALKPKNLERESRSFTSSSLSFAVILRPLSWAHSMSLNPLSFGWYLASRSIMVFSWAAEDCTPAPVTVSIICKEQENVDIIWNRKIKTTCQVIQIWGFWVSNLMICTRDTKYNIALVFGY